jgi:hypothetical protein
MVTLSPGDADSKDGDWVIWMSPMTPDIGNITNVHTIKHVKKRTSERIKWH